MINGFLNGIKIGMMIAMPVGPTMILLLRIGILRGLKSFALSGFGAAAGIGLAMALAVTFIEYIVRVTENYALAIHGILALMVLAVAWHVYKGNQKIKIEDLRDKKASINLWTAPLVSATCPFTSVLILNILASDGFFAQTLSTDIKVALVAGCVAGGFLGYSIIMAAVELCSRALSLRLVLLLVKTAPTIVLYYGLQGAYKAWTIWQQTL